VKTHVASLLRKLQLRDRIALVVWAHQHHGNS
jgi:DNA-binding NarL/FixJ family response regulator